MKDNEPRLLYEGFARDIAQTLPLVFTESLSYVQCIYLLYRKVNEVIGVLNNMVDLWNRLQDFQDIIQSWVEPVQDLIICNDNNPHYAFFTSTTSATSIMRAQHYKDMELPIDVTIVGINYQRNTIPTDAGSQQIAFQFMNQNGDLQGMYITKETTFPIHLKLTSPLITFQSNDCIVTPASYVTNDLEWTPWIFGLVPLNINVEDGSSTLTTWTNGNLKPTTTTSIPEPEFTLGIWSTGNLMFLSTKNTPQWIYKIEYSADCSPINFYLPQPFVMNLIRFMGHEIIYIINGNAISVTIDDTNKLRATSVEKNIIYDVTDNKFVTLNATIRTYTPTERSERPIVYYNPTPVELP